jgi:hypothetical protein
MSDKPYERHHTAVCNGDGALSNFMRHLVQFLAGAKSPAPFTDDDGVAREGIAYTWEQWADELGLTWKQIRRVLEKAEALGYIVRARRTWGRHHVIRLHVAVTEKYIIELTRCVSLGHKAYRKAIRAAHKPAISNIEGQDHIAHLGSTMLLTEGKTVLPSEGNYIEDSSHTHNQTLQGTAIAADADDAQPSPGGLLFPEEEKTKTPSPHSPPSPAYTIDFGEAGITTTSRELFEKLSIADAEKADHTTIVTSQGLATKLSSLGLLVEWQRVCAKHGVPPPENVTDEQLAALSWWCADVGNRLSAKEGCHVGPEECIALLVRNWTAYAEADDLQHVKATEKPDLDYLRQIVDVLKSGEAGHSKPSQVDSSSDFMQTFA